MIAELGRLVSKRAFDEIPQPECSSDDIDFEVIKKMFLNKNREIIKKDLGVLKILDYHQIFYNVDLKYTLM